MTVRALAAYGRAWRMRSCARRILLAATISIALVIFCVLLTLAILERISLVPGMASVTAGGEEVLADLLQRSLVLLEHGIVVDGLQRGAIVGAREVLQRGLEIHHLAEFDLVHAAIGDR